MQLLDTYFQVRWTQSILKFYKLVCPRFYKTQCNENVNSAFLSYVFIYSEKS
jgi:hypothetical protein